MITLISCADNGRKWQDGSQNQLTLIDLFCTPHLAMYSYVHVCPCPVFGSSFSNTISLLRPAAMFTSFRCFTDGCSAYDGTPLQERIRRLKQNRNVRPRLVRGLDRNLRDFAMVYIYLQLSSIIYTYRMAQHCTTSVLESLEV
jgi:hypothetical protein